MLFQQLLIDLFKFLAPFLRNAELNKPTHLLYKVKHLLSLPFGDILVKMQGLPIIGMLILA